jgi:RNA polymerase sigma-32 factor
MPFRDRVERNLIRDSLGPEYVAEIARKLGVPERDVIRMNRRLAAPDYSLNVPVRADSEGEWQNWLADESETQDNTLAEREEMTSRNHIMTERRLKDNPATLEELANHYRISRERVRQIEFRAFKKLQKGISAPVQTPWAG